MTPEDLSSAVDLLEPFDVGSALRNVLSSMVVIGPRTIEEAPAGFTEHRWSASTVEGRFYAPVPGRE